MNGRELVEAVDKDWVVDRAMVRITDYMDDSYYGATVWQETRESVLEGARNFMTQITNSMFDVNNPQFSEASEGWLKLARSENNDADDAQITKILERRAVSYLFSEFIRITDLIADGEDQLDVRVVVMKIGSDTAPTTTDSASAPEC